MSVRRPSAIERREVLDPTTLPLSAQLMTSIREIALNPGEQQVDVDALLGELVVAFVELETRTAVLKKAVLELSDIAQELAGAVHGQGAAAQSLGEVVSRIVDRIEPST